MMLPFIQGKFTPKCVGFVLSVCHKREVHVSSTNLWRVMFFGTDDFSLESLKRLHRNYQSQSSVSHLEVVTSSWKKNPVRLYSENENIHFHEWPVSCSVIKEFDVGLVSSFGYLIPKEMIDCFPLGILNVHASLLPRWRGAAPVIHAVLHGDTEGGVTIMRVRPFKFDEGEIVSMKKTVISPLETATQLRCRLASLGGDELIEVLTKLPNILSSAVPQPQDGITYAPKVIPAHGLIKFKQMTGREIFNRYRALCDLIPLRATWMGSSVRLHDISLHHQKLKSPCDNDKSEPGQILFDKPSKTLSVKCVGGIYIKIGRIAASHRKYLSSLEFYNGYLSNVDKSCWYFD